jgi:hypothetical protein
MANRPFNLQEALAGKSVKCLIYTGKWLPLKSFKVINDGSDGDLCIYGHYGVDAKHGYDYFIGNSWCGVKMT